MSRDWDQYIDSASTDAEKEARIAERNKWLDENAVVYGPSHVVTYRVAKNGDHIRSDGTLISTAEQRAKQDIPLWKRLEDGRLNDLNGYTIPGPNATDKDFEEYGENIEKSKAHKTRSELVKKYEEFIKSKENDMKGKFLTPRDIDTGEFIEVSELYIDKETGKTATAVNIEYPLDMDELIGRCYISDDSHVSMRVVEAEGSSDQVTKTNAKTLRFIIPERHELKGKKSVKLMFYFRKDRRQMYATQTWSCYRDMPKRLEVEETATNGSTATIGSERKSTATIAGFAVVAKPEKIMPDDPAFTPREKAVSWAKETHHGKAHQNRWNRVAATMGEENGYDAYSFKEVERIWKQFGMNKRWTVVMNWFKDDDEVAELKAERDAEMAEYNSPLRMQGHYSLADWDSLHKSEATICKIEGFDKLTIWDSGCQMPNFWLEEDFAQPTEQWRLMPDGGLELVRYFYSHEMRGGETPTADQVNTFRRNHGMKPMDFPNGVEPYPPECVFTLPGEESPPQPEKTLMERLREDLDAAIRNKDWKEVGHVLEKIKNV